MDPMGWYGKSASLCSGIVGAQKHPWGCRACQYLGGYRGDGDCLEDEDKAQLLQSTSIWELLRPYDVNMCHSQLKDVKDSGFSPNPYSSHFLFCSIYSSYLSFMHAFAVCQCLSVFVVTLVTV